MCAGNEPFNGEQELFLGDDGTLILEDAVAEINYCREQAGWPKLTLVMNAYDVVVLPLAVKQGLPYLEQHTHHYIFVN